MIFNKMVPIKIIYQFLVPRKDLCLSYSQEKYRAFDKFGRRGAAHDVQLQL